MLLLLAAMLAGAAAPAFAAADDAGGRRADARAEREQTLAEREARPTRAEQQWGSGREAPQERAERRARTEPAGPGFAGAGQPMRTAQEVAPRFAPDALAHPDSVRDWRSDRRRAENSPTEIHERNLRRRGPASTSPGDYVQQERALPPVLDRIRGRVVSRTPRPGTEPPSPSAAIARHAQPTRQWRGDWRSDRRYNWHDYRRRNRSLFHLGMYHDPFGWNYHRYGIGWRMWPSHYSNRYWLNDPWMYRLPPAYGPYRWVRYWDDALLVNIHTGEVVDVVHSFFW